MSEDLRYPVGKIADQPFTGKEPYDEHIKQAALRLIQFLPTELEQALLNLDKEQLDTPYRPGGWKVQQLVHHIADSHMNAFIRFKLGLTEDNPPIKPYKQDGWVAREDVTQVPVNVSLTILHSLHVRLYELLSNIREPEWQRTVYHPEQQRSITLWELLAIYSWHGRHHTAHITALRKRMNW